MLVPIIFLKAGVVETTPVTTPLVFKHRITVEMLDIEDLLFVWGCKQKYLEYSLLTVQYFVVRLQV